MDGEDIRSGCVWDLDKMPRIDVEDAYFLGILSLLTHMY